MKKLFNFDLGKIAYILEGIAAFLFAIAVNQLLVIKYQAGYFSKMYIILGAVAGLITLYFLIYNLIKSDKKVEKLFLTFMIPTGLFFIVFMLPTYAPDESAHIWKAYEVSQGYLLPKQDETGAAVGVDIPKILIEAKQETLNKYSELSRLLTTEMDYNDTTHLKTPAQGYPSVFYLPAAFAFLISRITNIPIMYALYIAKILNFIIFLIGGYYSIKKLPFGKWVLFACLFMPMVIQQAVSISLDSLMNTTIIFYISYTLMLVFKKTEITKKEKVIYCILIALVAIAKMAYILLIGLGFLLLFGKKLKKKDKLIILGVGSLVCIALVVVSYVYTGKLNGTEVGKYAIENNVNGSEQIQYIIHNPIGYVKMIGNTIITNLKFYAESCIVSPLGWLNIPVKQPVILAFLLVLLSSIFIENNEESFSKWQRVWNGLIIVGTIVIVITGLYVSWTTVGGNIAAGVQGRYFIPILPLTLLLFSMKNNYIKIKKIEFILPTILTMLNGLVLLDIYHFFR